MYMERLTPLKRNEKGRILSQADSFRFIHSDFRIVQIFASTLNKMEVN